jgi:hypothetical protein
VIQRPADRSTLCVVGHTTYGLTMSDGRWSASCSCGWRSVPSVHLDEQTDELDQHLRVVVIAEQRPTRVSRSATRAALQVVDHTATCVAVLLGLLVAAPLAVRTTRA